jgi:HlyD family secretion protein
VVREKPGSAKTAKPQDEEGVFINDKGAVKFAPVTTGLSGESNIEITSGLKEGQEIVTGPFKALRELKDGAKVKEEKEGKDDKKTG